MAQRPYQSRDPCPKLVKPRLANRVTSCASPRRPAGAGQAAGARQPACAGGSFTRVGLARGPRAAGRAGRGLWARPHQSAPVVLSSGPSLALGQKGTSGLEAWKLQNGETARGLSSKACLGLSISFCSATLSHPQCPWCPKGDSQKEEFSFSFGVSPNTRETSASCDPQRG